MLLLCTIPRNIVYQLKKSVSQQLKTPIKLLSSHDSSSSDSSDSDSDKECDEKNKKSSDHLKKVNDVSNTNDRLDAILQKITEASKKPKEENIINVAIKPKRNRFFELNRQKPEKKVPYEQKLVEAAKNVAKVIKGDTQKTELELLSKILNVDKSSSLDMSSETDKEDKPPSLSNLLSNMRIDTHDKKTTPEFIHPGSLKRQMAQKLKHRFQEPSLSAVLLHKKSTKLSPRYEKPEAELKVVRKPLGIFKNISYQSQTQIPQLSTWYEMEKKEMKLTVLRAPQNAFQEQILWTEQGKLWRFPINNEQGMEEEEKVHFSEHVFMERHLKDWCPRKGPIRHFMELVCTGLSKNPYMTVEEKVGHITWYKDYFEDKKDLLNELEILDNKPSEVSQNKKQIEA